jgi:hypothetical protein
MQAIPCVRFAHLIIQKIVYVGLTLLGTLLRYMILLRLVDLANLKISLSHIALHDHFHHLHDLFFNPWARLLM